MPSWYRSMSNTTGATVRPVATDVPVRRVLMKPVLAYRHPPAGLGEPRSWYCHLLLRGKTRHEPTRVLQGTGAGQPARAQPATGRGALRMAGAMDSPANNKTDTPTRTV